MKTLFRIIQNHIIWRKQLLKLAKADIVKTYSGAAFGWAWAIIKPTVMILVLWFAFSIGLRVNSEVNGIPYVLWILAGYIPWFYMQGMINQGAGAIHKYKYLVTKMKFPIDTIPTFVGLSILMVQLILTLIMVLIYVISGYFPGIYLIQLPIYILLMAIFFTFWGLFSSMLSAMSKDFLNLVKSLVTPLFWMSGIMWDLNKVDIGWLHTVMLFNPVNYFVEGYRKIFVYQQWLWDDVKSLGCFMLMLFIMIVLAIWTFNRTEKDIPDIL